MKKNIFLKALSILAVGYGMTSCLDGDPMNTPPGGSPPIVEMSYVVTNGTNINTGLQFFSGQTLLLNPGKAVDTIDFAVTIQGEVSEDVTVTLKVDPASAMDNFANDHLEYAMMPDDQWELTSTTGTIHAGETHANFQLIVYPPNINFTKNVILPITVSNDKGIVVSSNFGKVYFHIIGNPIAGLYKREFIRYAVPSPAPTDEPDIHTKDVQVVFAPSDPTTVSVPTGYYDGISPYIITFDDDGAGHLTNFKAVIDPKVVTSVWEPAGISIGEGPTIVVSPDYKTFTLHYTTATRNVTDIYTAN